MDTLFDASYEIFSDFRDKLEKAINELLPNSVPDLVCLIRHCKENGIDVNNRLSPNYADLLAWYENIDGYDAIIMRDQNRTFLAIQEEEHSIKVYLLNYFYDIKDMVPPLEDFKTIVAPYLREDARRWDARFEAIASNNITDDVSMGNDKECSIEPLFSLSFVEDDEGEAHKHVLLRAGFDLFSGIKDLNSLKIRLCSICLQ